MDVLVDQETKIMENDIKYYIKNYEIHGSYKKRLTASGILVAIKQNLTSSFKIIKEMNDQDYAKIMDVKKKINLGNV